MMDVETHFTKGESDSFYAAVINPRRLRGGVFGQLLWHLLDMIVLVLPPVGSRPALISFV